MIVCTVPACFEPSETPVVGACAKHKPRWYLDRRHKRMNPSRQPCVRGCGQRSQRPDGVCWRCTQKRKPPEAA